MMISSLSLTFIGQLVAAFVGTAGFAVLFGVPRNYYISCATTGTLGWLLYLVLFRYAGFSPTEATFAATALVCFISRALAVIRKCPATIFLICGIFPLVPGGGIFWTAYYMVSEQFRLSLQSGLSAIKIVAAIVLGILVISELPGKLFASFSKLSASGSHSNN